MDSKKEDKCRLCLVTNNLISISKGKNRSYRSDLVKVIANVTDVIMRLDDTESKLVCINCAIVACNCYLFKNVALYNKNNSISSNSPVDCHIVERIKNWLVQKISNEPVKTALSDNFSQTEEMDFRSEKTISETHTQTETTEMREQSKKTNLLHKDVQTDKLLKEILPKNTSSCNKFSQTDNLDLRNGIEKSDNFLKFATIHQPVQCSKYVQSVRNIKDSSTQVELNTNSQSSQTMLVTIDRKRIPNGILPPEGPVKGPIKNCIFCNHVLPLTTYLKLRKKHCCDYCGKLFQFANSKTNHQKVCKKRTPKKLVVELVRLDNNSNKTNVLTNSNGCV